jgi:hypothetical protein
VKPIVTFLTNPCNTKDSSEIHISVVEESETSPVWNSQYFRQLFHPYYDLGGHIAMISEYKRGTQTKVSSFFKLSVDYTL